ncbi:MAG: polyketide cyclase, partial [Bacteroidia bacterium]
MKKVTVSFRILATVLIVATIAGSAIAQAPAKKSSADQTEIAALRKQIKDLTEGNKMVEKYLVKFDTLDYTVFSNQEWVRLHESHSKDIIVHWPDGHFTSGIEKHIEDLKAMFVYA